MAWVTFVLVILLLTVLVYALRRRHAIIAAALGVVGFILIAVTLWYVQPFRVPHKLQILDQTTLPDGGMLILGQRYNGIWSEPSTISVYQRVRANLWVEYCVKLEAGYWRSGRLVPATNQVMEFYVYHGRTPVLKINCTNFTSVLCQDTRWAIRPFLLQEDPLANPSKRPEWVSRFPPNEHMASP